MIHLTSKLRLINVWFYSCFEAAVQLWVFSGFTFILVLTPRCKDGKQHQSSNVHRWIMGARLVCHRGKKWIMLNLERNTLALILMVLFVTVTTPPLSAWPACGSLCQTWALCLFRFGLFCSVSSFSSVSTARSPVCQLPCKNKSVRPRPTDPYMWNRAAVTDCFTVRTQVSKS